MGGSFTEAGKVQCSSPLSNAKLEGDKGLPSGQAWRRPRHWTLKPDF